MCWDRLIEAEAAAEQPASQKNELQRVESSPETDKAVDRILAGLYASESEEAPAC